MERGHPARLSVKRKLVFRKCERLRRLADKDIRAPPQLE